MRGGYNQFFTWCIFDIIFKKMGHRFLLRDAAGARAAQQFQKATIWANRPGRPNVAWTLAGFSI
ncbi:MAG: hypothetical protein B7X09_06260 [Acidiphilium sp. 21-66-27]|nr:MAG: hypothetical protein B7X09_06260 [Acidiphilium sp. 21-66-27]